MTILLGLVFSFPFVGPGGDITLLHVRTAPIRNSNLPNGIKGAILVSFLKEGMSFDEVKAVLGETPWVLHHGFFGVFSWYYPEYGISIWNKDLKDNTVGSVEFRWPISRAGTAPAVQ